MAVSVKVCLACSWAEPDLRPTYTHAHLNDEYLYPLFARVLRFKKLIVAGLIGTYIHRELVIDGYLYSKVYGTCVCYTFCYMLYGKKFFVVFMVDSAVMKISTDVNE